MNSEEVEDWVEKIMDLIEVIFEEYEDPVSYFRLQRGSGEGVRT